MAHGPARLAVLAIALGAAMAGCADGAADPRATSDRNPTTTSTVSPRSESAASTTVPIARTTPMSTSWVPADSREALRFVWSFDPTNGDPNDLATALGVAGVSPGLELPVLVEEGTAAVGSVVFEKLSERSSWGVPILLQMRDYGMPSGSMESPRPWPDTTLASIDAALATAADASYGACAQLMVDLNRTYIANEIERCASGECNWGRVWYAVPEAVTRPIGRLVDGNRFEGVITITSDTGAGDLLAITAERFDQWVITSRAPAGLPDAAAPNDCTSRE